MVILRRDDEIPKKLKGVLLPGERLVIAVHSHWASIVKPFAISGALLAFTIFVDANLTPATQAIGTMLWWAWLLSLPWVAWNWWEWRHDWFVATDKRLVRRYGIITQRVAMMPLIKVTDMSFNRTIPGKILGYGQFVMESAGQDQAMRTVDWVPHPHKTYLEICSQIFNVTPPSNVKIADDGTGDGPIEPDQGDDGGPGGGDGGPDGPTGSGGRAKWPRVRTGAMGYPDVPPVHNPVQDRLQKYSQAIPVRKTRGGESLYQSEDIRRRRRAADTGPVPLRPRHEPRSD